MRNHSLLLISALTVAVWTQSASAQLAPIPPGQSPAYQRAVFNPYPAISPSPNSPSQYAAKNPISPYLNLLRGGEIAANYYLDVVPMLQKQKKDQDPTVAPPRIDPKLDEEFRDMTLRRSTSGNLPSFGNYYGAYSLPNRGYVPYCAADDGQADWAVSEHHIAESSLAWIGKKGLCFTTCVRDAPVHFVSIPLVPFIIFVLLLIAIASFPSRAEPREGVSSSSVRSVQ